MTTTTFFHTTPHTRVEFCADKDNCFVSFLQADGSVYLHFRDEIRDQLEPHFKAIREILKNGKAAIIDRDEEGHFEDDDRKPRSARNEHALLSSELI